MKYLRNVLIVLLALMLALPACASAASRVAGYTNQQTYVYKKASTGSAKVSVGANTKLYVVGKAGSFYKVQNASGSATGYVLASTVSRSQTDAPKSAASWKAKVVKLDWFKGGSGVLATGKYGYLYDVDSGITMKIKRMGGHNHADVEPATAADTAKLLRIAGGRYSWTAHAVILRAGSRFVACSINTMPHGDQTIKNNKYNGQFCLHMVNSTTHENDAVNANHQAMIEKAYNWAH